MFLASENVLAGAKWTCFVMLFLFPGVFNNEKPCEAPASSFSNFEESFELILENWLYSFKIHKSAYFEIENPK